MHDVFKEQSYFNLSICRIVYYLYICFFHIFLYRWLRFSDFPSTFYEKSGVYALFNFGPLDYGSYLTIFYFSIIFSFFSAIGFLGRFSFFISFLGFTLLNSLPQLFQTLVGLNVMHTFVLFIFCFTHASRFISIDALLNRLFKKKHPEVSSDYTWPLYYFRYLYILCVFFAGLSKLYASGSAWFESDHLLNEIFCSPLSRTESMFFWPNELYQSLSDASLVFSIGACLVLLFELLSPLALFNKKFRYVFFTLMFAMHLLSYLLLFINPVYFLGFYVFWIDWNKLRQLTRKQIFSR